jgi:hypothetical protein
VGRAIGAEHRVFKEHLNPNVSTGSPGLAQIIDDQAGEDARHILNIGRCLLSFTEIDSGLLGALIGYTAGDAIPTDQPTRSNSSLVLQRPHPTSPYRYVCAAFVSHAPATSLQRSCSTLAVG